MLTHAHGIRNYRKKYGSSLGIGVQSRSGARSTSPVNPSRNVTRTRWSPMASMADILSVKYRFIVLTEGMMIPRRSGIGQEFSFTQRTRRRKEENEIFHA